MTTDEILIVMRKTKRIQQRKLSLMEKTQDKEEFTEVYAEALALAEIHSMFCTELRRRGQKDPYGKI